MSTARTSRNPHSVDAEVTDQPAPSLLAAASSKTPTRLLTVHAPAANYLGTATDEGHAVFAGVPFAERPIGRLRFRPPRPLADTADVVEATRFRAAPAQIKRAPMPDSGALETNPTPLPAGLAALAASNTNIETDEDCLYLNVWTPDVSGERPVIVWIYGGGFDAGSASPPVTDGAALSRLTGAVVVAVNYRVGAIGFGYFRGIAGDDWAQSSNLGLQDQIAGLTWIRRNIGAFGGDAANTTVTGESAGAFCIGSLLAIPAARTLFDKAILHSGSTRRIFSTETADSLTRDLMALVGAQTMEQLQELDVEVILNAQSQVIDKDIGRRNLAGGRSWGVVLDGEILAQQPLEAVRNGLARDIPLLMGANHDETLPMRMMMGAAWTPADEAALLQEVARAGIPDPTTVLDAYRTDSPHQNADLADLRTAFLTDAIYRRPAVETAAAQTAAAGHAWSFLFSAAPFGPSFGAGHAMDLLYVFDGLTTMGLATEDNLAVQHSLLNAWANFALTGDPGWPEYSYQAAKSTRQFGGDADFISEPTFGAVRAAWPIETTRFEQGL